MSVALSRIRAFAQTIDTLASSYAERFDRDVVGVRRALIDAGYALPKSRKAVEFAPKRRLRLLGCWRALEMEYGYRAGAILAHIVAERIRRTGVRRPRNDWFGLLMTVDELLDIRALRAYLRETGFHPVPLATRRRLAAAQLDPVEVAERFLDANENGSSRMSRRLSRALQERNITPDL